ncbi:MAG: CBS domain-containing protein [Nocardioides sp.]
MRAEGLAEPIPTVTRATTGAAAAQLLAEYRLPGVVVADAAGIPQTVIPGSQLLRFALPRYVLDDPTLAHAFDESDADQITEALTEVTIGQMLDDKSVQSLLPPTVLADDTLIEVASVMAGAHLPLVLCRDREGNYVGTVLLSRVLAAIAHAAGGDSTLLRHRLSSDVIERGQVPWRAEPPAEHGAPS